MTHIEFAVQIQAAPGLVFEWLASPERARVWMPSVSETQILDRKPGMIGTTFREIVSDENGSMELSGTVTAFEPGRRIGFHLKSRVNELDVSYSVAPQGDGAIVSVIADIRWALVIRLPALMFRRTFQEKINLQMQSELERLKAICESTP